MAELRNILENNLMNPIGDVNISKTYTGFNRENPDLMGQLEYCDNSSDNGYWRIIKSDDVSNPATFVSSSTFSNGESLDNYTLHISPIAGQTTFEYWRQGKHVVVEGTKSINLQSVMLNYIYFNENGELEYNGSTTAHELIVDETLVAIVGSNDEHGLYLFSDERHGLGMSGQSHLIIHSTIGFSHINGSDIHDIVQGATTHGIVESGYWIDEDITHHLPEMSDIPFAYLEGEIEENYSANWIFTGPSNTLAYKSGGIVQYNNNNGGDWGLTSVSSDADYIIIMLYASNNAIHPYVKIIGQEIFTTRNKARRAMNGYVTKLKLNGLSSPEMHPIGGWIVSGGDKGKVLKGDDNELWVDFRRLGFVADRW